MHSNWVHNQEATYASGWRRKRLTRPAVGSRLDRVLRCPLLPRPANGIHFSLRRMVDLHGQFLAAIGERLKARWGQHDGLVAAPGLQDGAPTRPLWGKEDAEVEGVGLAPDLNLPPFFVA